MISLESDAPDLGTLFRRYGTDKDLNGYTPLYETLLTPHRNAITRLLEIGIGTLIKGAPSSMEDILWYLEGYKQGASLRAWRDFFPNAEIVGIDPQPDTTILDEPRIRTVLADSRDPHVLTLLGEELFDVVIDDGLHSDDAWIANLKNLYARVREGGLYVIEDIFPNARIAEQPELVQAIVGHRHFFFGLRKNSVLVIQKRSDASNELQRPPGW